MSNDVEPSTETVTTTTPSIGKLARNIDPDINPWEQQPNETKAAYDAFAAFRDSEKRRVADHGASAYRWSSEHQWGYRAFEWDRYLDRKDAEDMVRYRRTMNERQRAAARLAQNKIAQWLVNLDPTKLTASEAARWLEVAVKIERLAGGDASERIAVGAQGSIGDMSAEEVSEALQGLTQEIARHINR